MLNSLLHTRNPHVDLATLREFFPETALPMGNILRSIVGHDHTLVEHRFTAFAQSHALNSTQLRFLSMLKEHVRQYGALNLNQLFQAPFTSIHTEGLGGVFPIEKQSDEVIQLVCSFGEPLNPSPSA